MNPHSISVYDLFVRNAVAWSNRPAMVYGAQQCNFAQLLGYVDQLAAGLSDLGLKKGDRLCVLAHNHPQFLELYGACAKLGILLYPINWRLREKEVEQVLGRARPVMMVVDSHTLEGIKHWPQTMSEVKHWSVMGDAEQLTTLGVLPERFQPLHALYGDATKAAAQKIDQGTAVLAADDDPLVSITTAAVDIIPRGAVLSHGNVIAANSQIIATMGLTEQDANLVALPLFHIAGAGMALAFWQAGGCNVIMDSFDALQAVDLIDGHQVTHLSDFPPILSSILDAAKEKSSVLSSLKHVSGIETPENIERLHRETSANFWVGFGQSETSGFVTMSCYKDKPGSAGKVGSLCQVRVVNEDEQAQPVGESGEIVVRGPMVFQGYYDQPQETAHAFRQGWHHSGDVGRFDADGFLFYVGRKPEKELIKPGGENVYPAEVEAVIAQLEGVKGVCVIGVPDAHWGEAVCAVVEVESPDQWAAEQISDAVKQDIASFKKPKHVYFTDALPKMADKTTDRAAVKQRWGSL